MGSVLRHVQKLCVLQPLLACGALLMRLSVGITERPSQPGTTYRTATKSIPKCSLETAEYCSCRVLHHHSHCMARCRRKIGCAVRAGCGLGVEVAKRSLFHNGLRMLQAALSRPRIGKHQTVHGGHTETLRARLESSLSRLLFMPCECTCLVFFLEASH
jgi:hypothetical protein